VEDIVMESAITSIMDCEDAVSAVDAEDKLGVYKNWLGLIRGELTTKVNKGSRTFARKFNEDRTYTTPDGGEITLPGRVLMLIRSVGHLLRNDSGLNEDGTGVYEGVLDAVFTTKVKKGSCTFKHKFKEDRTYTTPDGGEITLPGRVLMLIRNVGHLLRNDSVLKEDGTEAYEGILDAVFTSLMAKHNLLGKGKYINSKKGSIYIVKPKMHGSKEVKFTNDLFARVEDLLDLE